MAGEYSTVPIKDVNDQYKRRILEMMWTEWEDDQKAFGWSTIDDLERVWCELYLDGTIVAVGGGDIYGFCSLTVDDLGISRDDGVFLANLYVVPERRGMGVGRTLVKKAIEMVPRDRALYLWTYTDELVDWYRRDFGFEVESVIGPYLTQRCVTVMKLGRNSE